MVNYNKLLEKAREAYSKCVTGAEKRRLESIFPELAFHPATTEDEGIRKDLIEFVKQYGDNFYGQFSKASAISWLEKQGKNDNFFNKIQIGDKVTRNEDGVLVNLSQLERVANENEGEKETNKVELCYDHSPELKGQDRKMLESIIECIDGTGLLDFDQIDWLKSFKDKYSIKDNNALLEKQVEQADYNPYKAAIESIAVMVERYADNGDLKDFYDNIKVKCKDAMEYDRTLPEKQGELKETPCDRCKKEQPSHSCQDITELGRCYLEHEKQGEQKLVWSEEDKGFVDLLLAIFTNMRPNELFTTNNITVFNGDNVSSGRIATWLKSFKDKCKDVIEYDKTRIEKQDKKDDKVIFPKFTFDDILALECCMKMAEKEEEELYKQLQSLHNRVHDAYWLEREKEQKSPTKAEPEFKILDWVIGRATENEPRQIAEVTKDGYKTTYGGWIGFSFENEMRLWTVQDAKDGDVVADKSNGTIGIFQSIGHNQDSGSHNEPSYCFLHCRYGNGFFYADFENGNMIDADDLIPATKEQRNFLFKKMNENGYEWDSENKKLRKQCNQEPAGKVGPKFKVGDMIVCKASIPALIVNIDNGMYEIESTGDGTKGVHHIDFVDKFYHLWTIEDAEDGDVLAIGNTYFLFKGETLKSSPTSLVVYISHCFVHSTGAFRLTNGRDCGTFHSIENGIKVRPATKEQRDFLFQKMKEAGYGWDAKEKVIICYKKE